MLTVTGGKGTGKTAIISQFLYDQYNTAYKETVEEMYRWEIWGHCRAQSDRRCTWGGGGDIGIQVGDYVKL